MAKAPGTKPVKSAAKAPRKRSATSDEIFSAEEKAAMREYVRERKAAGTKVSAADAEAEVLARIDAMNEADRVLGRKFHAIVRKAAPDLVPRLWYGMPAYSRDGKVVCHFQDAGKFKTRYSTIGFSDQARLDDGTFWPVAFALGKLTAADEERIAALVRKAAG